VQQSSVWSDDRAAGRDAHLGRGAVTDLRRGFAAYPDSAGKVLTFVLWVAALPQYYLLLWIVEMCRPSDETAHKANPASGLRSLLTAMATTADTSCAQCTPDVYGAWKLGNERITIRFVAKPA